MATPRSPVRTKPPLPVIPEVITLGDPVQRNDILCWQASNTMMTSRVAQTDCLLSSTTAISNTAAATAFSKTYTIQPPDLNYLGAAFRISVEGTYSRTTSTSTIIRILVGGSLIQQFLFGINANATTLAWCVMGGFTVTAVGTSAVLNPGFGIGGLTNQTNGLAVNQSPTTLTKNLTVAQIVSVTNQWQAANAGDTIQIDTWTVEYLYPAGTTP